MQARTGTNWQPGFGDIQRIRGHGSAERLARCITPNRRVNIRVPSFILQHEERDIAEARQSARDTGRKTPYTAEVLTAVTASIFRVRDARQATGKQGSEWQL